VRDYDVEHDLQFVTAHPDWAHWRAECTGRPIGPLPGPRPRKVVTEVEAKFPPDSRPDAYGGIEPWPGAGWDAVMAITFKSPTAKITFRQWLFEDADYTITVRYGRTLDGGSFRLVIDDQPIEPAIPGRGDRALVDWTAPKPVHLAKGEHRIELVNDNGYGTYHDNVDRITFAATP
jgi:hypothetical protein